jgi:serine/threonine protein phosphatase PrpC
MSTSAKRKAEGEAAPTDQPPHSTHCTHQGTRPTQEDRLTIVDDGWASDGAANGAAESAGWPSCRFYAVFDGHCGDSTAAAASHLLWAELQSALRALQKRPPAASDESDGAPSAVSGESDVAPPTADALQKAVRDAFRATESQLLEQGHESGSTAVCALLVGGRLCVAHVGDSRCVLCHAERPVRLTEDHKPNTPAETARIVAAGGYVTTPYARGTENCPRLNGTLSVSRALGNAPFKRNPEGGAALSAEPDVTCVELGAFDSFVLLASDGLWDVLSESAAVAIVLEELAVQWPRRTPRAKAQAASDRLVREVLMSGHCRDNVTVVLVLLEESGAV